MADGVTTKVAETFAARAGESYNDRSTAHPARLTPVSGYNMTRSAKNSKLLLLPGVALAAAALLFLPLPAAAPFARNPTPQHKPLPSGKLSGTVLGPDGKPAAKARVMAQTSDGRFPRTTKTDAQGHFQLTCPAGLVDVRARAGENWSEWMRNVRVRAGETASITIHIPGQPVRGTEKKDAPSQPPR
jgi:hypothetical protein